MVVVAAVAGGNWGRLAGTGETVVGGGGGGGGGGLGGTEGELLLVVVVSPAISFPATP